MQLPPSCVQTARSHCVAGILTPDTRLLASHSFIASARQAGQVRPGQRPGVDGGWIRWVVGDKSVFSTLL